nr:cyclin-C1-1-like isoform X1 [Malus domestica]
MRLYISRLAQLVKVRQRVVATAVTYMRRVYTKKSMYDPRLVAPTCLCLASKAEESTRQAKLLVFYIKKDLLLQDAGLNDTSMTQLTWGVVNDTHKMDLALVHPPHLIALACICIASVLRDKDTTA